MFFAQIFIREVYASIDLSGGDWEINIGCAKFLKKFLQKKIFSLCLLLVAHRDLAQPGRALALGARCRWFESNSPDHV